MSTVNPIHRNPEQIGIADLIAYIEQAVSTGIAWDPFSAARYLEHMGVAASYVHEYYDRPGCRPTLFDLVVLDGDTVADRIAADLDREGKAGIAHSVTLLVDHARNFLDEVPVTTEEILLGTAAGWTVSTRSDQPELDLELPIAGTSRPQRIQIMIELLGPTPGDGASGGDSTVTPR